MEPTDGDRAPAAYEPGEGCLTTAVRLPVRIVVLVLVVPVRLVWDALVACAKAVDRMALRPLGRALAWLGRHLVVIPAGWIWRTLVVAPVAWLVRCLVVVPAQWLYAYVLMPVGRGIAWLARGVGVALVWLGKALFVWPWVALWRHVVVPVARGAGAALAWLVRYLVVVPAQWLYAYVLMPVGRGIAWLARGVGVALVWLGKALFVWPWVALWRHVVVPVARGAGAALAWLVRYLVVVPAQWLYAYVLTPVGHGIAWLVRGVVTVIAAVFTALATALATGVAAVVRWIVVVPAVALWRYVLAPAGRAVAVVVTVVVREVAAALGLCWRAAGFVSRAVWRFLGTVLRWTLVEPVRWVYRTLLTPLGHGIRDGIWRPVRQGLASAGRAARSALGAARQSVRQTRQEIRRALFGTPREGARSAAVPPRREPGAPEARTLGSSTTALTKD
ncbi:hypothetical protein AB0D04_27910 [Streptomyces sp. NPDC048483]|uniref:hypothetical protein n=1 Tax=Streptomyces sp. NPDC048483 TaxID=3154927 RepID=UPI003433BBDD